MNIKKAINELEKNNPYPSLNVEVIAHKANVDPRTARLHLELLEEDGLGKFCDQQKKTFVSSKK